MALCNIPCSKSVKALRVVRNIKGGNFTTESLEPNLLRQMMSEYSYSTWAADYARQHVLKSSETRVASNTNNTNTNVMAHHEQKNDEKLKPTLDWLSIQ